jgi:inosine-uridine nucleoside N-ribohydrolase
MKLSGNKILAVCFFLLVMLSSVAQNKKVKSVIFDSDMGPDYDDVGAITMLHAFADSGYINLLATIASTKYEGVAAVFNSLNTYFNRPNMPIAIPGNGLELKDWQHWTDTLLANYPHHIKNNSEVADATELYRKILSTQPDKSVTIVTVGFFTNLSNLLQSGPDKYSKLNGKDLIQKKVKEVVSMAGRFPAGKEFNVERDAAASQVVFSQWPTRILLSGFEVGQKIKVGLPLVNNNKIRNSPVKDVFRISIPMAKEDSTGRMSWDETAVLVAVKGYQPYYTLNEGRMVVSDDGSNTWNSQGKGHAHLVEKVSFEKVRAKIQKLIQHQPVKKAK